VAEAIIKYIEKVQVNRTKWFLVILFWAKIYFK
jgi:hypothetical protein